MDSGYYALPRRRNSELWVERTPDGFRFDVKAFSLLTGHPTRSEALPPDLRDRTPARGTADPALLDEVWGRFAEAIDPLRTAGRLGAVLFQFPPWFTPALRPNASWRTPRNASRAGRSPSSSATPPGGTRNTRTRRGSC